MAVATLSDTLGGLCNKVLHTPPGSDGGSLPIIHIAISLFNRGEPPAFEDLQGFKTWKGTHPVDSGGATYSTTLNHFVPICPAATVDLTEVSYRNKVNPPER